MDDGTEKKSDMINTIQKTLEALSEDELSEKLEKIEARLFEFANFMEARTALLYMKRGIEADTTGIIKRCLKNKKIVVLPAFNVEKQKMRLMKIDNLDTDVKVGLLGMLEPDSEHCKPIPLDQIDIAVIPGTAFDEKGGRLGFNQGYYDRLISKLPATTRKIAIAFEEQVTGQIPMESRNKYIDIIVTDERIIYKI